MSVTKELLECLSAQDDRLEFCVLPAGTAIRLLYRFREEDGGNEKNSDHSNEGCIRYSKSRDGFYVPLCFRYATGVVSAKRHGVVYPISTSGLTAVGAAGPGSSLCVGVIVVGHGPDEMFMVPSTILPKSATRIYPRKGSKYGEFRVAPTDVLDILKAWWTQMQRFEYNTFIDRLRQSSDRGFRVALIDEIHSKLCHHVGSECRCEYELIEDLTYHAKVRGHKILYHVVSDEHSGDAKCRVNLWYRRQREEGAAGNLTADFHAVVLHGGTHVTHFYLLPKRVALIPVLAGSPPSESKVISSMLYLHPNKERIPFQRTQKRHEERQRYMIDLDDDTASEKLLQILNDEGEAASLKKKRPKKLHEKLRCAYSALVFRIPVFENNRETPLAIERVHSKNLILEGDAKYQGAFSGREHLLSRESLPCL